MKVSEYIKASIIIGVTVLVSSCAHHIGTMSGSASITNNNFKITETAVGSAKTTKFLGLGSVKKNGLVYEAKTDLLNNYPLKPGQALGNVTVDFKFSYFFLITQTKAIIHADIIDFNKDNTPSDTIQFGVINSKGFELNEKVYTKIYGEFELCSITKLNLNSIQIQDKVGNVANKMYKSVFKTEGKTNYLGKPMKVGDVIKINKTNFELEPTTEKFTIVGCNDKHIIVKDDEGKLKKLPSKKEKLEN